MPNIVYVCKINWKKFYVSTIKNLLMQGGSILGLEGCLSQEKFLLWAYSGPDQLYPGLIWAGVNSAS